AVADLRLVRRVADHRVGDRRHAHGGAGGEARLRLRSRAVDADLARAGHLLDLHVGQVRPAAPEPAVQADAVLGLGDVEGLHLAGGGLVAHRAAPKARRASISPRNRAAIDRTTEAA